MSRAYARCSACPYRVRLRTDGTIGSHTLWAGYGFRYHCPGAGRLPRPTTFAPVQP